MTDKTKQGVPTRDFKDEGTGEAFKKGEAHAFPVGAYDNYFAAGLIEAGKESAAPTDTKASGSPPKPSA